MIIMIFGLFVGVILNYLVDIKANIKNHNTCFIKNKKVMFISFIIDIFLAFIALLLVTNCKLPPYIEFVGATTIGSNGINIIKRLVDNNTIKTGESINT